MLSNDESESPVTENRPFPGEALHRHCRHCGDMVPPEKAICPTCGKSVSPEFAPHSFWRLQPPGDRSPAHWVWKVVEIVLVVIAAVIAAALVVAFIQA